MTFFVLLFSLWGGSAFVGVFAVMLEVSERILIIGVLVFLLGTFVIMLPEMACLMGVTR